MPHLWQQPWKIILQKSSYWRKGGIVERGELLALVAETEVTRLAFAALQMWRHKGNPKPRPSPICEYFRSNHNKDNKAFDMFRAAPQVSSDKKKEILANKLDALVDVQRITLHNDDTQVILEKIERVQKVVAHCPLKICNVYLCISLCMYC